LKSHGLQDEYGVRSSTILQAFISGAPSRDPPSHLLSPWDPMAQWVSTATASSYDDLLEQLLTFKCSFKNHVIITSSFLSQKLQVHTEPASGSKWFFLTYVPFC
jgi:hypothetical protein